MTISSSTQSLLKAWTTVEVLSPNSLPEKAEMEGRLFNSPDEADPWLNPQHGLKGKEKSLYWMLYLGSLDLGKAGKIILDAFPDEQSNERDQMRGASPLAILLLDERGHLVSGKATLSSFAWGLGKLREKKIDELAEFPEIESSLLDRLTSRFEKQDNTGKPEPLDGVHISLALEWLVKKLQIDNELVETTWQTYRLSFQKADALPPEPDILNSFFLTELAKITTAYKKGDIGSALKSYLSGKPRKDREDVLQKQTLLKSLFEPDRYPVARWPGKGRHSLVLMQQAAVNHAVSELEDGGVTAINGPPGTGKTTLLRDMIAAIVVNRSIALSKFSDPEKAFIYKPSKDENGNKEHRYLLDETLLGHEIVVASSNNNAVENISREIPSSESIADDFEMPLRYFSTIADQLLAADEPKERKHLFAGSCWGLAAAVTGNAKNRGAFAEVFWWNNLKEYLWNVGGKRGDQPTFETAPVTWEAARQEWDSARKDFDKKLKEVRALSKKYKRILPSLEEVAKLYKQIEQLKEEQISNEKEPKSVELEILNSKNEISQITAELQELTADRTAMMALKPRMFDRFLRKTEANAWRVKLIATQDRLEKQRKAIESLKTKVQKAQHRKDQLFEKSRLIKRQIEETERRLMQYQKIAGDTGKGSSPRVPDEMFWSQPDDELQKSSPWSCPAFDHARDELFASSFRLHRAFIDAAAKPLRHNLATLFKGGLGSLRDIPSDLRQSLWASLFLVVPVLSTTFASFGRQFASLGREQIGWLMIDEAGQAVPQETIGAIWRSRRALIIGDPLQIEPVTSLPNSLTAAIFNHFQVSHEVWAAPWVSSQVLADRVSWLGTTLEQDNKSIWIGSPLRVHRRCDEPMFSLANKIAYNGLMVHATKKAASPIGAICGESAWIDVPASSAGKWSSLEGEKVIDILSNLISTNPEPDIFIVTPFREVRFRLQRLIKEKFSSEVHAWMRSRIGTVHTVQGKEAEAVIFVLGAGGSSSSGARRWAGSKVNLLNVAITRSKRHLYVIGNYNAWSKVPFFADLAQTLRQEEATKSNSL